MLDAWLGGREPAAATERPRAAGGDREDYRLLVGGFAPTGNELRTAGVSSHSGRLRARPPRGASTTAIQQAGGWRSAARQAGEGGCWLRNQEPETSHELQVDGRRCWERLASTARRTEAAGLW
ncbi:MAG: hypothetical protein OXC31_16350 [Spirochaetaceae bacterium]|nr:hypothetical protein [Spirochaetaceae bacterium]